MDMHMLRLLDLQCILHHRLQERMRATSVKLRQYPQILQQHRCGLHPRSLL
ncbi:hypothetical protein D1T48_gp22 [Thermoproteus tenax virus 1]|uniref:Uncharacterized 6.1 kDa protein n=1 Tax=Thermoproteus tenax virus 1 (strain KRA1) TaxID=10480 RepID=YORJ_TTV1K|nr:hypothetical protein D1T48_gp22 [Thermoproteus tenax virus 1]P19294.1 RecName: Full=Uncharacterized 6.1 kDa protein [Thermoproteus tenax virus 1 (STRAIN KRA1)]CAA32990.1 unnamed protein product [Thermoproteus tenax virus 1]